MHQCPLANELLFPWTSPTAREAYKPEGNVSIKKWKGGLGPETRHFLFLGLSYLVCQMREEARPFLPSILYLQRKFYDLINLKGTFPDLFNVGFSTL